MRDEDKKDKTRVITDLSKMRDLVVVKELTPQDARDELERKKARREILDEKNTIH